MDFNQKLQELRKQRGLTQEELAGLLFVSRTAVSKWESGRGYPGIDSLKAIAGLFGITLDELLSTQEMLGVAKEEGEERGRRFLDLSFGLFDVSVALLFFLPFFAQGAQGGMQAVSLSALTQVASLHRAVYFAVTLGIVAWGILTLALQNCTHSLWVKNNLAISLCLGALGVLLFIVSRQAYASAFLFVLLAIKALLLLKSQ